MKIRHWSLTNGSGMHRVAESFAVAEAALGCDSALVDLEKPDTWDSAEDADIHVSHTHLPPQFEKRCTRPHRVVWVGHGTPDHVMQGSAEDADRGAYGHSDGVMLLLHWLKKADARVTFWDRHKWMYDRMLGTGQRPTDLVPLGVDRSFWTPGTSAGKFGGEPSVVTCENPHYIKWPYDLMCAWPMVTDEYPKAALHAAYVVRDLHRAFFPFFNALGTFFHSYVTPGPFDKDTLRNVFRSTDYFCGLVRYGDLNHLSLQASATGSTTISYTGNPYADYWLPEGDQRAIAEGLLAIFRGEVPKREHPAVPDISDTAKRMLEIYTEIL